MAVLSESAAPAAAAGEVSLDAVRTAWQRRQDTVRTFTFEWTEDRFLTKGALLTPKEDGPEHGFFPTEDLTKTARHTLTVDGSQSRYTFEGEGHLVDDAGVRFVPDHYVSVFDGETSAVFWPDGQAGDTFPVGEIRPDKRNPHVALVNLAPLLRIYRPLHPDLGGLKFQDFSLAPKVAVIDGRSCVGLRHHLVVAGGRRRFIRTFWVDPQRDFLIARYVSELNDRLDLQCDFSYEQDPDHGWVPASWSSRQMNRDGSFRESTRATVNSYSLNGALPPEDFRVEFPPGARVVQISDKGHETHYISRPRGERRLITESELRAGVGYERLLETDAGEALRPFRQSLWGRWYVLAVLATVLSAGAVWVARRLAGSRGTSH